jgi:ubiquinol-cytochrome c reductase cytochrome b subunit
VSVTGAGSGPVRRWLDERVGLGPLVRVLFLRNVPLGVGVLYTLGFAAAFCFALQASTGVILALYYAPTPDHAYDSVTYLSTLPFGSFVRGLHHWGASAMVVLVLLHLVVVFSLAAYRRPREGTWLMGVALLLLTLGFGFTGYLLPWDEKAYWATNVGTNMAGTTPLVGESLLRVVRGGTELGAAALTRFYAVHVLILPALLGAFLAAHVALVIWHGVSVPPSLWDDAAAADIAGGGAPAQEAADRYGAFKQRGRPFWPNVIFEDLVIALVVFIILAALAATQGAPLEAQADPTDSSYVPRPEWYFLFLYQLLRYIPGQWEWIGIVGVPLLAVAGLLALPILDRGEARRLQSRPVAAGGLVLFAVGIGFLTSAAVLGTPPSHVEERGVPLTTAQILGRTHYRQYCAGCHGANGEGTPQGPALTEVGQRQDADFIHSYIENPQRVRRDALMPGFLADLGHQQVEEVAQYVLTMRPEAPRP